MKILTGVLAIGLAMPVAAADLVTRTSAHDVATTVDRLAEAVEGAGAKVFARIDHAAGAANVGSDLRPTQMLMFGNPKLGTPVMLADQAAGLDLPLRVVVYQTESGDVILAYQDPAALSDSFSVPADAEILAKMSGALEKLTTVATAP